jgi:hypothetical protein
LSILLLRVAVVVELEVLVVVEVLEDCLQGKHQLPKELSVGLLLAVAVQLIAQEQTLF